MSGILEQIFAEKQKTNALLERNNELLEQLIANGGAPAGDADAPKTTTAKGKSTAKGKTTTAVKPNHTKDEVVAAVVAVKDAFGAPAAKAITAKFGLAKIADAKEEHFDPIFDLCQEKLAEAEGGEEEEDEGV